MPDIWMDVDTAVTVPTNLVPLVDATDGKTLEVSIAYNETGMNLSWNFVTSAGVMTTTAITPTTGGDYDWTESGTDEGMYKIEIPASGGASANNDTEGYGWISGTTTSCLPFRGPTIGFRRAALNDLLTDGGTASTNLEDFFDGTGYAGGTAKLNCNVSTITNGAITAAAIATDAIDADAIADNAIDAGAIANGSFTSIKFADDFLTAAKIADNAIDAGSIAAGAITNAKFAAGAIDATAIANSAIDAATFAAGAIDAAAIADNAIDLATFAADVKTGSALKANVETVTAGAITAAAIANGAIDNATFAADVGSTAFATNIIATAVFKALDSAIGDAVSLTSDGLLEKVRKLSWIIGNKITVTDANGNTVIYKDDNATAAYTVNSMLTDDSTTTTRLRAA